MIDDVFVINAVSHTYNMLRSNVQPNREAEALWNLFDGIGGMFEAMGVAPPPQEGWGTDWSIDLLAKANFLETDMDIAAHHTLALYSWFKDGFAPHSKTVEALTKYPDRFLGYAGVDPLAGVDTAIRELDMQLEQCPKGIVGLKLYPTQVDPYRVFRMDDPKLAFPLFEHVQKRGLKTVAVHKALPFPSVPMNPYRIDDVDGAAAAFPELSFEIVHAGMTFAQETAYVLAYYPNVYAELEGTSQFAVTNPKLFEEVMAEFVRWGGPLKIIYGDGGALGFNTQDHLEAIMAFQFSDETCERYGINKLTREDKAMILGGNFARIIGLDIEEAKAKIADDEFSRIRRETGLQPPYSNWKAHLEREMAPSR